MYKELVESLREESEIERWLQPHSANETPKLLDEAADVIEELSKERKLGSWRHYEGNLTCSECAVTIYDDIMSLLGDDVPRFCPNCGAKMEG